LADLGLAGGWRAWRFRAGARGKTVFLRKDLEGWGGVDRLAPSFPPDVLAPPARSAPSPRLSPLSRHDGHQPQEGGWSAPKQCSLGVAEKVFWYLEEVDNLFSGVKCARPLLTTSLPLSTPATRPPHPAHARSCTRVLLTHEQALHAQGTWRLLCRASEACRPRRTQLVR